MEIQGPYDLINIVVNGSDTQARPTAWEGDFNSLRPVRFQTTCPKCSQLIDFGINDINDNVVICKICIGGIEEKSKESQQISVVTKTEIIDPIEAGLFPIDIIDMAFLRKCNT